MDEWRDLAPFQVTVIRNGILRELRCFSLAVYRGQIFKIGGGFHIRFTYHVQYVRDVQCYDPASDSWRRVSQTINNRKFANTFVHDDALFVIGGDRFEVLNPYYNAPTIERFDADSQTFSLVG